jgi:hypothetical protein
MHLEDGLQPLLSCLLYHIQPKIQSRPDLDTAIFSAQGTLRAFAQLDLYLYANQRRFRPPISFDFDVLCDGFPFYLAQPAMSLLDIQQLL